MIVFYCFILMYTKHTLKYIMFPHTLTNAFCTQIESSYDIGVNLLGTKLTRILSAEAFYKWIQ